LNGGADVPQDDAEAVKWYRKSADGGNGSAQFTLGSMYEWGRGVEPDNVQADMWYSVAIATMSADGRAAEPTRSRNDIEQRMTPEQIAEARKRAQEWKPTMVSSQISN